MTSLSVDEMIPPKYVNLTTNFREPPFTLENAEKMEKIHNLSPRFSFYFSLSFPKFFVAIV